VATSKPQGKESSYHCQIKEFEKEVEFLFVQNRHGHLDIIGPANQTSGFHRASFEQQARRLSMRNSEWEGDNIES
jgi:hypothetical protein